jgi:hypothetical protein
MRLFVPSLTVLILAFVGCSSEEELAGPRPLSLQSSDPNANTTCGNGFCEVGESHESCANDCCELGADGACVAACGNGFCEQGETARSCPSECS